jgi:zinc protease
MLRALFPDGHPYQWPTIGYVADLQRATLDDAQAFLARFYQPANASLVVAGSVTASDVVPVIEELFGRIPGGPSPATLGPRPPVARPGRTFLEDRVELPRLYLAWPTPALFAAEDAELDLAADVLANGRTSRLYRRLIHDRRVATDVAAAQSSRQLVSSFQLAATAAPGVGLDELHAAATEEIARLSADGPNEDEQIRGRAQAEAAFVYRVQSLGGFGGLADQLNAYVFSGRPPDSFEVDLARYTGATSQSIQAAVARWLIPGQATAVSVVPAGAPQLALAGSIAADSDL